MTLKGFFTQAEVDKVTKSYFQENTQGGPACGLCKLHHHCANPKLPPSGKGELQALIVAEANGPTEDQMRTQLIGKVGQFFRDKLKERGCDLDQMFWRMNAVNCWPNSDGKTRAPTLLEVQYCRPLIEKALSELKPKIIWLMGGKAIDSFYMDDFKYREISRWRGTAIPDRKYNAWVFPMFHPSYPTRDSRNENLQSVYGRDLDLAIECLGWERPFDNTETIDENHASSILRLYTFDDIRAFLQNILDMPPHYLYFDYETTGLKPFSPGHRIACASFAAKSDCAVSFPIEYAGWFSEKEVTAIKTLVQKVLKTRSLKMAHNIKFEDIWSRYVIGGSVENWYWDTMIAAHIRDNRKNWTGLKFQTYINFGVRPYDKHIAPFLHASDSNSFNRVDEIDIHDLLTYCGLDSLYGMKLFMEQSKEFAKKSFEGRYKAFRFFMDGMKALSDVQINGVVADENYYIEKKEELTGLIKQKKQEMLQTGEVAKFRERFQRLPDTNSTEDMRLLLYEIVGAEEVLTDNDNLSIDASTLNDSIESPLIRLVLETRKLEKVKGTYLAQFLREVRNGRIHPFFDLHIPRTYRGSSSNPNLQNVPVRDAFSKKITRMGLKPSPGNRIIEGDYSSIEVRTAGVYTQDRSLIKYLVDKTTDMHRDSAVDIWMLPAELLDPEEKIRFYAKNCWVFPQFYGSYYGNCGNDLWKNCAHLKTKDGVMLKDWLREKHRIKSIDEFKEHLKDVERIFWKERFKEYAQWKIDINRLYRKQGHIESLLGFQYVGYMTEKEVSNYPIQGTAFHFLLWTLIELNQYIRQNRMWTKIIGQIHDSILLDTPPDEFETIIRVTNEIGTRKLMQAFPFINIPIKMDFEATEIDEGWGNKAKVKGVI